MFFSVTVATGMLLPRATDFTGVGGGLEKAIGNGGENDQHLLYTSMTLSKEYK